MAKSQVALPAIRTANLTPKQADQAKAGGPGSARAVQADAKAGKRPVSFADFDVGGMPAVKVVEAKKKPVMK